MARQTIVLGTTPGDATGEGLRAGGVKINTNFAELYSIVADLASIVPIATYTADRTLALGDAGVVNEGNSATALTFTVPPNSAVAFPIGSTVELRQVAAGPITVAPGAGVTLRTASTLTTRTIWSSIVLHKRGTDEWVVGGDTV